MKKRSLVILFVLVMVFTSCTSFGALRKVPTDYDTIQAGIDAAIGGDTVLVADDFYSGVGNRDLDFLGKAITVRSAGDDPSTCTLEGHSASRAVSFINGEGPNSILRGFTLQHTEVTDENGGAVLIVNSSPTITNCVIYSCSALGTGRGGGLYIENGGPVITDCEIKICDSDRGGAVYCTSSIPLFKNCLFFSSTAVSYGGGIFCTNNSTMRIYECTFDDNNANFGAGIWCEDSSPIITNSKFSQNAAGNHGGGAAFDNCEGAEITNCLFYNGNTGGTYGGGITCAGSTGPDIINCTINGNTAGVVGGGIHISNCPALITNCIVWNNSPESIYVSGTTLPDISYSCIEQSSGVYPGTGNINSDPLFVSGPLGYYYLDASDNPNRVVSPCINIGSNLASNICFPTSTGTSCMNDMTTHMEGTADSGLVDLGFHYREAVVRQVPSDYTTIQQAVDACLDGDIVLVADGTYTGAGNKNINFTGKTITVKSENGPESCSIDSEGNGRGFQFSSGETRFAIVDGFTIENGGYSVWTGGGIFIDGASPTIRNCTIQNNDVAQWGAGIYCLAGNAIIDHCIFQGNHTGMSGGAIYNDSENYSGMTITNCEFTGNTADEQTGAIVITRATYPEIANCLFQGNEAVNAVGGLSIGSSDHVTIANSCFWNNIGAAGGGGISLVVCDDVSIYNCTIANNSATEGAGINLDNTSPTITDCIIWGNTGPEMSLGGTATPDLTYCDIQGGWSGTGNINDDPLFETGPGGNYYLNQTLGSAGNDISSPCVDTGSALANQITVSDPAGLKDMADYSTRIDGYHDMGIVDMGFHYRESVTILVPGDADTIQAAIDASKTGDTVLVSDGTYTGTGNKDLDYRGKPIIVKSVNGQENCVIDCENSGRGVNFESGETAFSVFQGFTITNGYVTQYGGGIQCAGTSPVIADCTITNCDASYSGGIDTANGEPFITNCVISECSAQNGGGIYCFYADPTITNCSFISNTASNAGAGIGFLYSDGDIRNCMLRNNAAGDSGGALYIADSAPIISNCSLVDNSAGNDCGGMYCLDSSPILINSIIWDNSPPPAIENMGTGTPSVFYSDTQGSVYPGEGNFSDNPLFVSGPDGDFYLYHIGLSRDQRSPCIDTGSTNASNSCFPVYEDGVCLNAFTTRIDGVEDTGVVDLGFHYPAFSLPPTPTPTPDPCIHNGDINFDMSITAEDAQLAFSITLGAVIPTYEEECAADCNGDGSVSAGDAQQIFGAIFGGSCADPL